MASNGNINYRRSADRERAVKHSLERAGFFAVRSSGSHGPVDVVGLRPSTCGHCTCPDVFQAVFHQIKVSTGRKSDAIDWEVADTPGGLINVQVLKFAVGKGGRKK